MFLQFSLSGLQIAVSERAVHTTSLSLPVNYLRIRYRLPTRTNSTRQTRREIADGKKRKPEDMTRGGEVAPRRPTVSAALKGHVMLSKDHLQSPTLAALHST